MKRLQSKDFKSAMLLGLPPGEQVSIQCRDLADVCSKATACRNSFRLKPEQYKERGVESLTVQKIGDTAVLVTLNPIEKQEPFTDTLLEGDTAPEDEAYN